jgi:AraC family L-rhamnose operon regulatory protein RhaS
MIPSRDPFHELFHVVRGRIDMILGEKEERLAVGEGAYTCVPAGMRHQVRDASSSTILLLCLSQKILSSSADRFVVWRSIVADCPWVAQPQTKYEIDQLHHHLRRLMTLQQLPETARNRLALFAKVDETLLAIDDLRRAEAGQDAGSRVRAVMAGIEGRVYEHWSVQRAARESALSARRFSELFRELTGTTFVPWLQERRIRKACQLLASGSYTIAGAAFSSGFEDLSTFYRTFQKLCGRTPRQWVLDHEGRPIKPAPPPCGTAETVDRSSTPIT